MENPSGLSEPSEYAENPATLPESSQYPEAQWEVQGTFDRLFRTLAAAMTLGLTGLFVASTTENTASGFLGAFCLSLLLQTGMLPGAFRPVANDVSFLLTTLLGGLGLAGVFFSEPSPC